MYTHYTLYVNCVRETSRPLDETSSVLKVTLYENDPFECVV